MCVCFVCFVVSHIVSSSRHYHSANDNGAGYNLSWLCFDKGLALAIGDDILFAVPFTDNNKKTISHTRKTIFFYPLSIQWQPTTEIWSIFHFMTMCPLQTIPSTTKKKLFSLSFIFIVFRIHLVNIQVKMERTITFECLCDRMDAMNSNIFLGRK